MGYMSIRRSIPLVSHTLDNSEGLQSLYHGLSLFVHYYRVTSRIEYSVEVSVRSVVRDITTGILW